MTAVTIALAQMKMAAGRKTNLAKSLDFLRKASERGADLILYPEVQLSPFFAQYPKDDVHTAEAIRPDDEAFSAFQKACREYRIAASPNFYYWENSHSYDASFLIDREGEIIGIQKMVHIAQAEKFYEQDYYTPSDDGFHVFEMNGVKIGIVVCFDRHYPESIRTEALKGAEIILIPTANTSTELMELFTQEIRVQAFQNECFIAMCNRIGTEGDMVFAGASLAADPDGRIIAEAGDEEELLLVKMDPDKVKETRNRRPYLSLRRTEWYI
jgi:predicted amidohydrolase